MNALEMNKKILSDPVRRKEVAFHEAAHFVILLFHSKQLVEFPRVERVSILPENTPLLGYVRRQALIPTLYDEIGLDNPVVRRFREARIKMEVKNALAGAAADYIHSEFSETNDIQDFLSEWSFNDTDDLDSAMKYIQIFHGKLSEEEMEEKVEKYFVEVLNEVKLLWSKIENVAKKLLEVSVFQGDELTELTEEIYEEIETETIFESIELN
jgi:formate dehydrogenase maturation protein FdhE